MITAKPLMLLLLLLLMKAMRCGSQEYYVQHAH